MNKDHVVEVVLFRLRDGASREEFLAAAAESQVFLQRQPGFLQRQLLSGPDGQWVDLGWWDSMDKAMAAAKAFESASEASVFESLIDFASVNMMHLHPAFAGAVQPR